MIPAPSASRASGRLAENVMHFARVLRAAGLPIGPASVLDAVQALTVAGIERREDWYAVLSCIFIKRREHRAVFDQAFHIFWRDPAQLERMMSLLLPQAHGGTPPPPPDVSKRLAEALAPQPDEGKRPDESAERLDVDTTLAFSTLERLQHLDFEAMSGEEWRAAKSLIEKMRLPIRDVATRRHRQDPRGARLDLADTLRKSMRWGGDSLVPQYRSRVWRQPPLVVLCDISGSMHRYTRMFLYFLHGIARDRERLHVLLFGTRLTNITRQLKHRDVDVAVNQIAASVQDWAGGTRIGPCLHEFNQRWSRRLLGQNAVVLLISDGLDRDSAADLGQQMDRLHKSCRELIWLNPLLRFDGFEARPAGIRAMLPHVDRFLPVHNLESLRDLAAVLSGPQLRRQETRSLRRAAAPAVAAALPPPSTMARDPTTTSDTFRPPNQH